jgi:hypothetical protein
MQYETVKVLNIQHNYVIVNLNMTSAEGNDKLFPNGEHSESPDPSVYVWPEENDEPFIVPQSVVFDTAIRIAAEKFPDITELDVLSPEPNTRAMQAHQLMLLMLDNTSLDYKAIAAELGYQSVDEVEKALKKLHRLVDTDPSAQNSFAIFQLKYKIALKEWQAQLEEQKRPVIKPPALDVYHQDIFKRAREEDSGALAYLEQKYDPVIEEVIDSFGATAPAEIIDYSWQVFDELLWSADLSSPVDFAEVLRSKLEDEIRKVIELQRIAELTKNLSMRSYLKELKEFDKLQGKKQIKSPLEPKVLDEIATIARQHLDSRLDKSTDQPLQGYIRVPTDRRPVVAARIRTAYGRAVIRRLKVSALMAESGAKEFHLSQLPPEMIGKFLSITLDEIAKEEIERVKQYHRKK